MDSHKRPSGVKAIVGMVYMLDERVMEWRDWVVDMRGHVVVMNGRIVCYGRDNVHKRGA
jgi:tartrate dehydratase beta subunit/fumarate hydratase class I family protein